ncbi:MAG: methionine--tRNA ligase [Armatimonadetes bacterium]|nr:methionine--tRNA ligase [Armatimonadota bacterium]
MSSLGGKSVPEKAFYITTPIYYVTDMPHVGNASTTIAADVVARFKRLQGRKVLFATGTDENAIKVAEMAQSQGISPQGFVDGIVPRWIEVWKRMHVTYDAFIRTTEERHRMVTEHVFRTLMERGDIYKDSYHGWYCVSDETFFRESEVTDGLCPNAECRKEVRWVEEENYFFRLSAYGDRLLEYFEANPDALGPDFRRNEVLSFIKSGLKDACISRKAYGWGIPVPGDPDKVIYVWFDALLNYLTVAGYLQDDALLTEMWPPDLQLMAKEIFVRFHATMWPAMLMGLGLQLPKRVFAHGFWTIDGQKISKSKGNSISPDEVAEDVAFRSGAEFDIAMDALRYFMMREATFGLDADFSVNALIGRFNADLANDLGNLLNRTLPLLHKHRGGIVPSPVNVLTDLLESEADAVVEHMDRLEFSEALGAIWAVIGRGNKYMEVEAPWKLAKDESCAARLDTVLYTVLDTVRSVAIMIQPFMPCVAQAIWEQLGIEEPLADQTWEDARTVGKLKPGTRTAEPKPIFPRIDTRLQLASHPSHESHIPTAKEEKTVEEQVQEKTYLTFDEFKKIELKVAKIIAAEKVEGADKLLKLRVDLGAEERQVVAGIAQWYTSEELIGREIVLVANLAPRAVRGVESQGMLLAADLDGTAVLLAPDKEVPPGAPVR